jgi:two-component system nitrogen regulation sensor histidine kinase NtrY
VRVGRPLKDLAPEFQSVVDRAAASGIEIEEDVDVVRAAESLRLRLRVSHSPDGLVLTFDDITRLVAAQRNAAWKDVARRIAHEIKNPLTPIQLSAERLRRKYRKEITVDLETFDRCTETIIRQVGDIGRMVDEFSAFARMPQPVIRPEDIGMVARETLVLQRTALPRIKWSSDIPPRGPVAPCDRRMMRQAITNLLRNAADAVAMREGAGAIEVSVAESNGLVSVQVIDDGIGLPREDRARLTEPYVTHKPKGTGLGLAIVKKIMEDHGGQVTLDDRPDGPGTVASLVLPMMQEPSPAPPGPSPEIPPPAPNPPVEQPPAPEITPPGDAPPGQPPPEISPPSEPSPEISPPPEIEPSRTPHGA